VREDGSGIRQQLLSEIAHTAVALDIFRLNGKRFLDQFFSDRLLIGAVSCDFSKEPLHPVNGPE
jgi:hypothetical protein